MSANVDLTRVLAAYARDLTVLQKTQKRDLRIHGHFSDFIQKNGAVVGQLEFSRLAQTARSGKRALVIAEQLTLHQLSGKSSAVHGNERSRSPAAGVVHRLGEKAPCPCHSRRV